MSVGRATVRWRTLDAKKEVILSTTLTSIINIKSRSLVLVRSLITDLEKHNQKGAHFIVKRLTNV